MTPNVGREAELLALYERDRLYFVRLALRAVRAQQVDDVLQDAFLRAWQHMDQWSGEGTLKSWFGSVVFNTAQNQHRLASARVAKACVSMDAARHVSAPGASPERRALIAEIRRRIADLPPAERDAVDLWIEGIQPKTKQELNRFKVVSHRGRKRLAIALAPELHQRKLL